MSCTITNVSVVGLNRSIMASGLSYSSEVRDFINEEPTERDFKRTKVLGPQPGGSGHSQFLHGIIVYMTVKFSLQGWPELQRYHFPEIISSQSKMHKLKDVKMVDCVNEYVDKDIIAIAQKYIDEYNTNPTHENFLKMIYNVPSGFEYTADMVFNYESLKTIYRQRRDHKLTPDWKPFCDAIEELPYFNEFIKPIENNK